MSSMLRLHSVRFCRLSLPVLGKNVVSILRRRVARVAALCVIALGRFAGCIACFKRSGRLVVFEYGVTPTAAVRKSLAVLLHEIDVLQGAWNRSIGKEVILLGLPMDLGHFCPVRDCFAIAWKARAVSLDH